MRTLSIRYTDTRRCPNCEGRGDDGARWRPFECRRCRGRGALITGVEVVDSVGGALPRSAYDFNERGEVFLVDYEVEGEVRIIRPEDRAG